MANLEGMPIGSLQEATSIQDEDEIVVYRPSTGKAYQANTDLIDSIDIFNSGTQIQSGDDLNDYTAVGRYNSSSSTISASLSNAPITGAGFALFVFIAGGRRVQLAVHGGSASGATNNWLFIRDVSGSTWTNWFSIVGTNTGA